MRRRHFLTLTGSTLGGVLVYGFDKKPKVLHPDGKGDAKTVRIPLKFFTEVEAHIAGAAVGRIFPSDETGPGAKEAGVVVFIDRQLASAFGRDRFRYTEPPFEAGIPEQGYQGKETPREVYREGLKLLGAGFDQLSPAEQDARLKSIETTYFFRLLRQNTIEGMFCDPMHGGNAGTIGWQLIGFPGPYMTWADDMTAHYGEAFRPKPKGISEVLGRKITPWEETAS
jgi:gluconate 2-dehydrogenase gamma chain